MKHNYRKPRIVMSCAMLVVSMIAFSQANLLAYDPIEEVLIEALEDETQIDSEPKEIVDAIVVDSSSNIKAYPSLEEEMDMYMKLRTEIPLAYFFPNPSNGIVWIEHNLGTDASVRIKDDSGELVFEAKKMKAKKLDLSKLETGRYSIELIKDESRVVRGLKVI